MAKTSAWMPLYIGDYLADTMHLTTAEHGAYLLLIMHYWRMQALPDDDKSLASIAKVTQKLWDGGLGLVIRRFFQVDAGELRHKRIDAELQKALGNSSKRRDAANARWKQNVSTSNADADANASDLQCTRNDPRVGDLHLHSQKEERNPPLPPQRGGAQRVNGFHPRRRTRPETELEAFSREFGLDEPETTEEAPDGGT